jgi:hypothetical protein
MPRILCTFPGRHGDILWALPTVRAIAEANGGKVDLLVSGKYKGVADLINRQDYIGICRGTDLWPIVESAPMEPRVPPDEALRWVVDESYRTLNHVNEAGGIYDHHIHLGYTGWPALPLPYEIEQIASKACVEAGIPVGQVNLDRPWIARPYDLPPAGVVVGFTEEYFELKVGISEILFRRYYDEKAAYRLVNVSAGPRWEQEYRQRSIGWDTAAAWMAAGQVFVGCCSALHVLAVAVGVPQVVLMEPSGMREHEIFWPLGKEGRVQLVRGHDGTATFDSRHVVDAIEAGMKASTPSPQERER